MFIYRCKCIDTYINLPSKRIYQLYISGKRHGDINGSELGKRQI